MHGFLFANGRFSKIDFPQAVYTIPDDINDFGVIAGDYRDVNNVGHGFINIGALYVTFGVPGTPLDIFANQAQGINDIGEIVGVFEDFSLQGHGYLYRAGTFSALDYPGAATTRCFGINNHEEIVGDYFIQGIRHAFKAVRTDE